MGKAKDLIVKFISAKDANKLCKQWHYSGKVVPNSQLHFGIFYQGRCEGVMQYGPSMDKRKTLTLVKKTGWNDFLELNRMAFSDRLPKNSESRAIAICHRLIRKHYPYIDWIISYSDATQCGDGTIYRASGFKLIGIKKNTTILELPDGTIVADITLNSSKPVNGIHYNSSYWKKRGAKPLQGFQLRYIYFLNKSVENNLTVPTIPFSKIKELGIGMYKGIKR